MYTLDPFGGPFGGGAFDTLFKVFMILVPVVVIGGFVFAFGSMISTAVSNSQKPLLTRRARVVSKRMDHSTSLHHHGDHHHVSHDTSYFVTFEFEDGHREEFSVRGDQYGLLAEGDVGDLQSQGTWFKGFYRD